MWSGILGSDESTDTYLPYSKKEDEKEKEHPLIRKGEWKMYVLDWRYDGEVHSYVGITKDLQKRLRQHNKELSGGATYTSNFVKPDKPWVYRYVLTNFEDDHELVEAYERAMKQPMKYQTRFDKLIKGLDYIESADYWHYNNPRNLKGWFNRNAYCNKDLISQGKFVDNKTKDLFKVLSMHRVAQKCEPTYKRPMTVYYFHKRFIPQGNYKPDYIQEFIVQDKELSVIYGRSERQRNIGMRMTPYKKKKRKAAWKPASVAQRKYKKETRKKK